MAELGFECWQSAYTVLPALPKERATGYKTPSNSPAAYEMERGANAESAAEGVGKSRPEV